MLRKNNVPFLYSLKRFLMFSGGTEREHWSEQKQPTELFYKKGALSFLTFLGSIEMELATLFKKRLRHKCFPVNFTKFLTKHLRTTATV